MDDRRHTCRALGDREGCLACQAVNLRMGNPEPDSPQPPKADLVALYRVSRDLLEALGHDPDAPHLSATLEALPGFLALLPLPQAAR